MVGYGTGPSSYSQTTSDQLVFPNGVYVDDVSPAMTVSKTYIVRAFPSAVNTTRATWYFKWYTASSGAEVANAVDLSAESVQFGFDGGNF